MKRTKYILTIFLFTLMFLSFIIPLYASNGELPTIYYEFENNEYYPYNDDITFDKSFNMKQKQEYTEHYEATYSFESENDGAVGTSIDFVDTYVSDIPYTDVSVKNEYDGHRKILHFDQNVGGSHYVWITNNFQSVKTDLTLEFWLNMNGEHPTANNLILFMYENNDSKVRVYMDYQSNGKIVNQGSDGFSDVFSGAQDQWYHIKLTLDDTNNLIEYTINSLSYGWFNYILNTTNGIDRISFGVDYSLTYESDYYIDSIGIYPYYNFKSNYTFTFNELTANTEFATTGIYSNWTYQKNANTNITVRDSNPIDQEFLRLYDNTSSSPVRPTLDIPFTSSITNSFSAYLRFYDSATQVHYWNINDGVNERITLFTEASKLYTWSGVSKTEIMSISDNIWYNISISFDCSTDTFQVSIDDSYIDTYDFYDNSITLDTLHFRTDLFDLHYHFDIDSITNLDYVKLNYSVGTNLFPSVRNYSTYEVDKDEFALGSVNQLYTIGSEVAGYWKKGGVAGVGTSDIQADPYDSNDRIWKITTDNGSGSTYTFRNTDGLYSESKFIEIEMNMRFGNMSSSFDYGYYSFYILSSDEVDNCYLYWWFNGSITYYNGSHPILMENLVQNWNYTFNLKINYELEMNFLEVYNNGIYNDSFTFPIYAKDKTGISAIYFLVYDDDKGISWEFDSVGTYANKLSLATELGYNSFDLDNDNDLSLETYNNLHIQSNGNFSLTACSGSFATIGQSLRTFRQNEFNMYSDTLLHINNYLYHTSNISNPSMIIWINGTNFNLTSLEINGIRLYNEYEKEYYEMSFLNAYIDDTQGYFYVDQLNRLNWYCYFDDTDTEYMKATFNIANIESTNYSLGFSSLIDYAYGYIYANYTSVNQEFDIYSYLNTRYYVLAENYTLSYFNILITDNDNDDIVGLSTGYIYDITLFPTYTVVHDIVFSNVLFMFIPLIIIFLPSLLIGIKYRNIIIPMILIMSIIAYVGNLIPIWLLFIVFLSSIVYFIINREIERRDFL